MVSEETQRTYFYASREHFPKCITECGGQTQAVDTAYGISLHAELRGPTQTVETPEVVPNKNRKQRGMQAAKTPSDISVHAVDLR